MAKRVFIIHRWDGKPTSDWYPWLRKELEIRGLEVIVPEMPNTEEPKIEDWVNHLKGIVGVADKNTYFIGHSIGCQTIMRYLEILDKNIKVGGALFVAGWFYLKNLESKEVEEIAKPWLKTPIDLNKVKNSLNYLTIILSENDPYNYKEENRNKFEKELGADKTIVLKNKGHFTEDEGITELPSALNSVLELAKNE